MHIIPVIDLMNGIVVHARHGNRQTYQPIQSLLCETAKPGNVINGFLELYPFTTMYIADINRLSANGNNTGTIIQLVEQYPHIQFWVDQGILHHHKYQPPENWLQIIGTESLTDAMLATVRLKPAELILSLDFKQSLIGSSQILEYPEQWPQQVIVMSLNKVGADTGPDWILLQKIKQLAMNSHIVAAGGIRGTSDLIKLSEMGIHRALLASSLHSGKLSGDDLHRLSTG
ncbi:MAG TPA: hypothetical protein ENJ32_00890 [Crenotrichaceae bacterium]|nr:hypothetical protein [Crenotrichaceae bacterium]